MIQTIITLVIVVAVGFIFGFITIKLESAINENQASLNDTNRGGLFTKKELVQRRGSWRFAMDQLLFDSALKEMISEEADIKVH